MDAFDDGQQTGVAAQFLLEGVEGAETFFGLGHEVGIALEGAEAHRIVDVGDGDSVLTESFAEEHVFVAVVAETLVEGVGEHQVTPYEEVGCMKVAVWILSSSVYGMLILCRLLVEISEIASEGFLVAVDTDAPIGYFCLVCHFHIFNNKVGADGGHVAVDEEQQVITRLAGEEISDGGPSDVDRLAQVAAMTPLLYPSVLCHCRFIGGAIVAYQYLIVDGKSLCLATEVGDQLTATVVVGGYKDG